MLLLQQEVNKGWPGEKGPLQHGHVWVCKVEVVVIAAVDGNVDATLDQGVVVKLVVVFKGPARAGEDCQLAKAEKVVAELKVNSTELDELKLSY